MDSILTSIKKLLGIDESYHHFDTDIIMHINSVFMILHQLGIGPENGFSITDEFSVWDDYLPDDPRAQAVKTYIYCKVKLVFDPPLSSAVIESLNRTISELEWRLNIIADELPKERRKILVYYSVNKSDELKHFGVKGMKWGVRRKQTTLSKNKASTKPDDDDTQVKPKKKSVKEMSDAELRAEITRKQLENQYNQLNPKHVSAGKKFVDTMTNKVIIPGLTDAAKQVVTEQSKKMATDYLNKKLKK